MEPGRPRLRHMRRLAAVVLILLVCIVSVCWKQYAPRRLQTIRSDAEKDHVPTIEIKKNGTDGTDASFVAPIRPEMPINYTRNERDSVTLKENAQPHESQSVERAGGLKNETNKTVSTSDSPALSFTLNDIDQTEPIVCGKTKCLAKLRGREDAAYLVSPRRERFRSMRAAWEFVESLPNQTNITMEHIYQSSPWLMPLDPAMASWLENNRVHPDAFHDGSVLRRANRTTTEESNVYRSKSSKQFQGKEEVLVQLVTRIDQSDALQFGCLPHKFKPVYDYGGLQAWLTHVQRTRGTETTLETFDANVRNLDDFLEQEPCLWHDFQVFITSDGRIIHFDVDRCFVPPSRGQRLRQVLQLNVPRSLRKSH